MSDKRGHTRTDMGTGNEIDLLSLVEEFDLSIIAYLSVIA